MSDGPVTEDGKARCDCCERQFTAALGHWDREYGVVVCPACFLALAPVPAADEAS